MPAQKDARNRTLILHIGDHKTGSTSIQIAFAKGQVTIADKTVTYPAKLNMNALGAQCRAYRNADTTAARAAAQEPFERLAQTLRQTDTDFIVLSAEELEGVSPALLQEIFDRFFSDIAAHIRVVAYVRPHAARITSTYAERIKIGTKWVLESTLEEFGARRISEKGFVYAPRFTALRKQFGSQFVLRPMIRNQLHQGSVVDDFVHHAFQGLPYTISDSSAANESLCLEDLMRLKVLHNIVQRPALHHRLGWEFSRLTGHLPPPPSRTKIKLHKALADQISAAYLKDARTMDKRFFDGVPLFENELRAAVETAIPEAQSCDPKDHLNASELHTLTLMSNMVSGLLQAPDTNWPAFLHKKRLQEINMDKHRTEVTLKG